MSTSPTSTTVSLGAVITEHGRRVTFTTGEFVFAEGDRSDHVYCVLAGRVDIVRALTCGRQLLFGAKHPGDEFGELSALDGGRRAASAVTAEPTVLAKLSGPRFVELLAGHPDLALSLTRTLAAELRATTERLCTRNSDSAVTRAGHQLLEMAMLKVKSGALPDEVELTITQRELADWIGATREATARALGGFRRAGLIETGRGRIVLRDVRGLTASIDAL